MRSRGRVPTGIIILAMASVASFADGQAPLTRAERTEYRETSRYADVMGFLEDLTSRPDVSRLHLHTFGYSYEGRALPLVVAGRDLAGAAPAMVRATGRLRVLVFANIHGGEVEGKEATQMLLRAIAGGQHDDWLDAMVLLVAPIYNADGNERVAVTNRWRQNGPEGGVGERGNAQGLDLNRDHTKLRTPEARSLVRLMTEYDPHLVVDLHATNGTHHAYHLTYSPPLHPNTDERITTFLRERWLPAVTTRIHAARGWHLYYYGNAYAPDGMERGWYTFDHRPRFSTNYVGLRNRFAILSEAYAYLDFQGRVDATRLFVEEILDFARDNAPEIAALVDAADRVELVGQRLGLRASFNRDGEAEILMGATEERLDPVSGRRYLARLDSVRVERMPEFGTFRVTEWERVPHAYYVPPTLEGVADLLAFHGIAVDTLADAGTLLLERFAIDSTRVQTREFQGHREREVFGRWEAHHAVLPAGTLAVPVSGRPLARLLFHLLEPRSDDGALNWNLLDAALEEADGYYPILRAPARAD